jgi:hypothetical protein
MSYHTVTCVYKVNATGKLSAAAIATLMPAIVPDAGTLELLGGITIASNAATTSGNVATYTVVFDVFTDEFNAWYTNPTSPFSDLLTEALAVYLNQPVLANAPVAA